MRYQTFTKVEKKPPPVSCGYDPNLKIVVHRFNMGSATCVCGKKSVKLRTNWSWKNNANK